MDKRDFDYPLPEAQIAQEPLAQRSASRMLHIQANQNRWDDYYITDLPSLLAPGDLMIFNDTKVIPARLFGQKTTGGKVEVMVERILGTNRLSAKIRANKPLRPESEVIIGDYHLICEGRHGELFTLALTQQADVSDLLKDHGHVPLPPYIHREDTASDQQRYQTVWARYDGAVAAPTAGLHFDEALLDTLRNQGVEMGYVTLHVGSGTYQRLRDGDVSQQRLHSERIEVTDTVCEQIKAAKQRGSRVIAVGTTSVRSLEAAAAATGEIEPYHGETELFIKPGDAFNVVDAIVTNFHEPQSSLVMLVSAFAGRETVLSAYAHAVNQGYRFLSYGDATFVTR